MELNNDIEKQVTGDNQLSKLNITEREILQNFDKTELREFYTLNSDFQKYILNVPSEIRERYLGLSLDLRQFFIGLPKNLRWKFMEMSDE